MIACGGIWPLKNQLRLVLCDIDDFTIAVRVRPRPDNIFLKINASDFLRVGDDRINDLVVIGKNKIPNFSFWLVLPNDVSFFCSL